MDIVVIGSGPAGVSAAVRASIAGLRVTIIQKLSSFEDILAEPLQTVHPGLRTLLSSINIEKSIDYSSRASYDGFYSNGVFKSLSGTKEMWQGDHICRISFDNYLNFCLRKYNITFATGESVSQVIFGKDYHTISFKSGKKIKSRYIIDASGRSRLLGKLLNVSEQLLSPSLTSWTGVASNIESSFFENCKTSFLSDHNGWIWLAPEPPQRCTWTRLGLTKDKMLPWPELLQLYTNDGKKVRSFNVTWRVFKNVAFKRIFLIGDAAGIIDPSTGQGILKACLSGIMASDAIISTLNENKDEIVSMRQYKEWFLEDYYTKVASLRLNYLNMGIKF